MKGDFLVRTKNPRALDEILNQFGALLLGGPDNFVRREVDCYVVCVLDSSPRFIKFVIANQGYGEFVRDVEEGEWFPSMRVMAE